MRRREEEEKAAARRAALAPPSYLAIDIPPGLGMDCGSYRWRQSQSHVEIFLPLPDGLSSSKVSVVLQPQYIAVEFDEKPKLKGQLYRAIKADESTWYCQDGVLEILMLKRNRKGNYENRTTNADTFWRSVLQSAPEREVLAFEHPPTAYYWAPHEEIDSEKEIKRLTSRGGAPQAASAALENALPA